MTTPEIGAIGTPVYIKAPIGRMVSGDPFEAQTKDKEGRPLKDSQGNPKVNYFLAVAYEKHNPEWPAYHSALKAVAARDFPNLFPQGPMGPCTKQNFAWKIIDGDTDFDENGKPFNTRPGFAGCHVVRYSSPSPIKVFQHPNYAPEQELSKLTSPLKRGHYVQVNHSVKGNGQTQTAGLFMTPSLVSHRGYGPEIQTGPDAATIFADDDGQPNYTPAGMSATPVSAVEGHAPVAAAGPLKMTAKAGGTSYDAFRALGWTDQQLLDGGYAERPTPTPPAAPTPPAPPAAPTPPAAPATGLTMTPAAGTNTYASYIAAGWKDEQLIAQGLAVAPVATPPAPPAGPTPPPNGAFMQAGATPPAPPAAPTPPAPPAAPAKTMTPAAGTNTYESYIAAGWTDQQLIDAKLMTIG